MTAQLKPMYSEEEYLELERVAEFKSEYYRGEIFAMAGAGHNHNCIVENLSIEIGGYFKGKSCRTLSSDMRLYIPENGLYTYPDLLIICGKSEFQDDKEFENLINPTAIFEVLSPSTAYYDRGEKFHFYRSIETLKAYVLIDSQSIAAEVYEKTAGGVWQLTSDAYTVKANLEVSCLGLSVPMQDLYVHTNLISGNH